MFDLKSIMVITAILTVIGVLLLIKSKKEDAAAISLALVLIGMGAGIFFGVWSLM